nr:MAG TPA: hypothetical protein [Caudoviricetes sp.]
MMIAIHQLCMMVGLNLDRTNQDLSWSLIMAAMTCHLDFARCAEGD